MIIEKEGKFFKADDTSKQILVVDGKEVEATPEEVKAFQEANDKGGKKGDEGAKKSIEDLAKENPDVAKLLEDFSGVNKRLNDLEEEKKKKEMEDAKAKGEFEKLFTDESTAHKDTRANLDKVTRLLDEYKQTTEGILTDVMKGIPKEKQSLIPAEYSPRKKLEYIIANGAILGVSTILKKGDIVPPNDGQPLNEEATLVKEIEELRLKANKTPMELDLMLQKATQLKNLRKEADNKK